jgi:hypothetical protein
MSRLAGRTRIARKLLLMAAVGLPLMALVPCRQVTGAIWSALAQVYRRGVIISDDLGGAAAVAAVAP